MNPLPEQVILVDDAGQPIGTAPKATVHHAHTPLHLAFSVFLFDDQGRALFQQRALHKPTWPGVWSNACCGHPLPGESFEAAAHRRLAYELGITARIELTLALPHFRYRAQWAELWENEICPVFIGRYAGPVAPNPAEVAATRWVDWHLFADACIDTQLPHLGEFADYSPWSRWEAADLIAQNSDRLLELTSSPQLA
ncbi:isopentenyl-diphosphate Delta-isomerase [Actomonas aquatica]|uniref:Isopentenyl-diphosphate delta-isomerase n=1 Tax=Actomonas aquatica TaxID=2866162 RepID=A0ABZ1C4I2_9BACT|nr:isopentenyl-diphosphate Delta-isomerase [Opitutus sp. WL0086]WRQ86479.1 isopentenyl-diphosphate Delta-isomerase [Opitutus sp. WL0086]